jgi:hypothetical protein
MSTFYFLNGDQMSCDDSTITQRSYGNNSATLINFSLSINVTILDDYCFENCTLLTKINIPYSVITLGAYCFANCTNISSVNFDFAPDGPPSNESIGDYCFYGCSSLYLLELGALVNSLGIYCFANTTALRVLIYFSVPEITDNATNICEGNTLPMSVNFNYPYCVPPYPTDGIYSSNLYPPYSQLVFNPPPTSPYSVIFKGSELLNFMNTNTIPTCLIFNPIVVDSELISENSKSLISVNNTVTITINID